MRGFFRALMQSMSISLEMSRLFLEYMYWGEMHCIVKLGSGGLKYLVLVEARHLLQLLSYMFCPKSTVSMVSAPLKTVTRKISVL